MLNSFEGFFLLNSQALEASLGLDYLFMMC